MNWVWDASRTVGNDRLVLLAIADRASDEGMDAWPSIAALAKKTRLHARTVQRCIRNIEALGELGIEAPRVPGSGPNVYVVRMDAIVRQPSSRPNRRQPPHPRQIVRGGKLSPHGVGAGGPLAASPPGGGVGAGGGVAIAPPDSSCTSSTSGTPSTTAASPRTLATEPNERGNYAVVARLAFDLCQRGSWETHGQRYVIDSSVNLVDALKDECGRLGIDRGLHPDVARDVVHRAAESEWFKHTHPELVSREVIVG